MNSRILEAASCFSYIVKFQNQPQLWEEISKLTEALRLPEGSTNTSGSQQEHEFYLKMFQHLSYEVQHKILLLTANHLENSQDHCRMILLLMKRFPQAISQHARCLLDNLIAGIGTSNAQPYREMLINEALPLILQKPPELELPSNLLNLVVSITIEHYVEQVYRRMSDDKFVTECWRRVFETLEMCGRLMKWEKFVSFSHRSKEVYWTRLVQIVASAGASATNRDSKQIFYTSLVLFLFALQEYMSNVGARKDEKAAATGNGSAAVGAAEGNGVSKPELLLVEWLRESPIGGHKRRHSDAFTQDAIKIIVAEPTCNQETPSCLITAAHCWQLLNSSELLQLETNQLLIRLPISDWLTRFISDLAVYLGRKEDFQAILKTATVHGMEKDVKLLSLAVLENNLGMQTVGPLILNIVKELAHSYATSDIPQGDYMQDHLNGPSSATSGRTLILLPMTKRAILQYCVRILVSKLSARMHNLMAESSDLALGYLLVLCQLNWPNTDQYLVGQIFNMISTKRSFTFLSFSKYIVVTEFIEEFAYLWSQQKVSLELTANSKTRHNFGTRRADKGVKDDFKQILRDQIQRSHEDMDFLIILFILQEHNLFSEILL